MLTATSGIGTCILLNLLFSLAELFEHFLADAADGAVPVFGQIGKGGASGDFALAVALVGAVDVAAVAHLALVHGLVVVDIGFVHLTLHYKVEELSQQHGEPDV